jgi:hypothetical protein
VDWIFLCHCHSGLHEKTDPFDFITAIGSNRNTGETCFFGHDQAKFDGEEVPVPGGYPGDAMSRQEAAAFWNTPSHNTCLSCHTANKPWAITPHVNQSRLGGDGTMDFIPEVPKSKRVRPGWGFRVIGTVHNLVMPRPQAIVPKNDDGTADRSCTRCHVVTDQESFFRLSRIAVGYHEDIPKYAERSAGMPLNKDPWMPPVRASDEDARKAREAVDRIGRALADPSWRLESHDILTPCPAPGSLPKGDVRVLEGSGPREIRWTYRNDYGSVPARDDIRFEVSVVGDDGTSCRYRDVAPQSLGSDQWVFHHPDRAGTHYTYRLTPYRYCFDRTAYRYGETLMETPPARPTRAR